MGETRNNRGILIAVVIVLLIILVGIEVITLMTNDKPKEKKEKKEEQNNLCVENLCISKVSFEDNNGGKSIRIDLKNTGTEIIEELCVKIVTKDIEIPFCAQQLEKETILVFENNGNFGEKLKDYKLVKMTDKEKNEEKTLNAQ